MPISNKGGVLLDTNILLRYASPLHDLYPNTINALTKLWQQNQTLYICPQNIQEFRQVATRPLSANGFGLNAEEVIRRIELIEKGFSLVTETPAIYLEWRRISEAVGAIGRANFDVRLVAVASSSGIDTILTYEAGAFQRYAACVSGMKILDPLML